MATKIRKIGGLGFKTLSAESGKVRTDRDKLQSPDWERFDEIGFNFRMNQMAAAVALAQMERADFYIDLRRKMGLDYAGALSNSSLLTPQFEPLNYFYTYYTFSARFNGVEHGISWADFRKKYIEFGGDGIYAASKLLHQEPAFSGRKIGRGQTPIAVELQKNLMNFTTNQANEYERAMQTDSLTKTLKYFGDHVN